MHQSSDRTPKNDLITAIITVTYYFPNDELGSLDIVRFFNKPFELNCFNMLVVPM